MSEPDRSAATTPTDPPPAADPRWAAYNAFITQQLTSRTRIGSVLCAILMPFGVVLDLATHPDLVAEFLGIRFGFGAGCGLLYGLTYVRLSERLTLALSITLALWVSAGIEVMVVRTGAADSPYYAGLNLILLGMGLLYPWTTRQMATVCSLILTMYVTPALVTSGTAHLAELANNAYFLLLTSVIAVTSSHFGGELRRREFFARAELETRSVELKHATDRLADSLQKLREADRLRSQFFANMSHELRTPLTLILSPLEAILQDERLRLEGEARDWLQSMHRNALRLLRLINNLLDLAKLEAGKVYLRYEPIELRPFLASLLPPFQAFANKKNVQLALEGPEVEAIYVDAEKLDSIVQNLVANALKFTPEGGTVRVRLDDDPDSITLSVLDTGIGIAEKDLPIIFDRFAQADGSVTRRFGGTGIGLALVKELVELHGGRVSVQSTPGVGSVFSVTLPKGTTHIRDDLRERRAVDVPVVRDRRESNRDPLAALMPKQSNTPEGIIEWSQDQGEREPAVEEAFRPRVLIVEDNVDMRRFLARLLSQEFQVIEAVDGDDGLRRVGEHRPDVVLSDVMMPGRSGYELTEAIKTNPKTRTIPVILLTAKRGTDAALRGFTHGADDYLGKPFNARELMARIRAQLRMRELSTRLAQSQKMSMLGTLAAGLAHEVRNPVNFISNSLPLLRRALEDVPGERAGTARELLDIVAEGMTRIDGIVRDLLSFSHVDRATVGPWSPSESVRLTLKLLGSRAENVRVVTDLGYDGVIEGRGGLLDQVLMNLCDNALRAVGPGGHVEIGTRAENGGVRVRVRDDGPGIAPEVQARIFDPFFTTRAVGEGTGLGLHLARQTILAHGGSIEVRSAPGQGAELTFWLPEQPPEANAP